MMNKRQEIFEYSILLESELAQVYSPQGEKISDSIDGLCNKYLTLAEVQSEYGKDLGLEFRERLVIIINERFDRLSPLQQQIAKLKYNKDLTYRQISEEVDRSISTISHHMKQINKILRSI